MLKSRFVGAVLVAFVACGIIWGQDAAKPTAKSAAKESVKEAAADKLTGRLPSGFGKLDVTDTQKQKIYAIQAKYKEQIDALNKQIDELQNKRDTEIEAVLTPEQKEKLKSAQKESADKKAAAKTKTDEKKPDTPK